MTNYRLPMDADGVKYHGTVDQNEENPGHFMYGLDENGNKRIIRTDEQGNVLTRVTGSKVEFEILYDGEITAGSTVNIIATNTKNNLSKQSIGIFFSSTGTRPTTLHVRQGRNTSGGTGWISDTFSWEEGNREYAIIPIKGEFIRAFLTNNHESYNADYHVWSVYYDELINEVS